MKKHVTNITFCQNIAQLRETHHLSRREMAKRLGITAFTLHRIEKGCIPSSLSCEILLRAEREFHIHPKKLFEPPRAE